MIRTERRLPLRYLLCFTIPLIVLLSAARPVSAQSTGVEIGVDEKLGEFIPLDVIVTDADGKRFTLAEYIDRPTILALAYYRCPDICTPLMMGLTDVLQRLDLTAGEDFRVLTIGFDPRETTMDAMHSRDHMMGMFRSPFIPVTRLNPVMVVLGFIAIGTPAVVMIRSRTGYSASEAA